MNDVKGLRSPNLFEKILLVIGIFFVMFGYTLIHMIISATGTLTWAFVQGLFLWLIIIILLILIAVAENVKEELRIIINEHAQEVRLLAGVRPKISAPKKSKVKKVGKRGVKK